MKKAMHDEYLLSCFGCGVASTASTRKIIVVYCEFVFPCFSDTLLAFWY